MPRRAPPPDPGKPKLNRNQKAVARLLELAMWIRQTGENGFTLSEVSERFPDWYRGKQQADKAWTRDKTELRRMGLRFRETAPGRYVVDDDATRPARFTFSVPELAVLDAVATAQGHIRFGPAAHHVHVGLRKLALAGVPLSNALDRLRAERRAWRTEHKWFSMLKGIWVARKPVIVDYREPGGSRVQRHTVKVYNVFFDAQIFIGDSDLEGRKTFFLPNVCSMSVAAVPRKSVVIPEGIVPGGDEWRPGPVLEANIPDVERADPGRPVIRELQRSLTVGYLLLGALYEAAPSKLSWAAAIARSGARARAELDSAIEVLESLTLPDLLEEYGYLGIERRATGVALYLKPQESVLLALRPIEVAMLIAVARSLPNHAPAVETLGTKLLRPLMDEERATAEAMAAAFRFDAPGSEPRGPGR